MKKDTYFAADIGKTIWSRGGDFRGKVKSISQRYCAACGMNHTCYIVEWNGGETTKPCTRGVKLRANGDLEIV